MTFTCKSCEGECKYAVAPPVCPLCLVGGQWHDREETEKPITTAYDRAQAELVRRIEALEAEVAKLKAWSRPPELMCMICGTGFATDAHKTNHRCGRGAL